MAALYTKISNGPEDPDLGHMGTWRSRGYRRPTLTTMHTASISLDRPCYARATSPSKVSQSSAKDAPYTSAEMLMPSGPAQRLMLDLAVINLANFSNISANTAPLLMFELFILDLVMRGYELFLGYKVNVKMQLRYYIRFY